MSEKILIWHERPSGSKLIASVWSWSALEATTRTVVADPCTSLALITENGSTKVVLRGPETKPRKERLLPGYTCTAIRLRPGVALKGLPARKLVNRSLTIWSSHRAQFWFNDAYWQFPDFDNAEILIDQFYDAGYIQHIFLDNIHMQTINTLSSRAYFRLVKRTTGLSPYQLYQLNRMHQAVRLLKLGMPATRVASELDFVDQAHFIHASKRFLGHTPKQLVDLLQQP